MSHLLLWTLADGVWNGAMRGAVRGAIIGGVAGALIWGISQFRKRGDKDNPKK
jgi:hypothetical protein